jgi:hypothetical protein
VTATDGAPGEGFNALLKDLGLIGKLSSDKALDLRVEHVGKGPPWHPSLRTPR